MSNPAALWPRPPDSPPHWPLPTPASTNPWWNLPPAALEGPELTIQNTTAHSLLVAWRIVPGATGYRVTWRVLSGERGVGWKESPHLTQDGRALSLQDP